MGFKKNMKKAGHLGKKSAKAMKHLGRKIVKDGPEVLVKAGATFQDVGRIGEAVGQGLMMVDPMLGEAVISGSQGLQEAGTVTKQAGRSTKKIRRGDISGAIDKIDETFYDYETGERSTYTRAGDQQVPTNRKKHKGKKKKKIQKEEYAPVSNKAVVSNVPQNESVQSISSVSSNTMPSRTSFHKSFG